MVLEARDRDAGARAHRTRQLDFDPPEVTSVVGTFETCPPSLQMSVRRNRTCCRRANIDANDPTRTSSFGHTGEAQAAKIALAPGNIGWVVA
jgi:hypothetical protein